VFRTLLQMAATAPPTAGLHTGGAAAPATNDAPATMHTGAPADSLLLKSLPPLSPSVIHMVYRMGSGGWLTES
jgi:hypothetical protein